MSDVVRTRCRRSPRTLLLAGLLSASLLSCGRAQPVEVGLSGLPPAMPPTSVPATSFQGAVAEVDAPAGALVVAVQIVWTPVLKADPRPRRVLIDAGTRWEPAIGLADLRVGEEVQVDAVDAGDGNWRALRVQLFDID